MRDLISRGNFFFFFPPSYRIIKIKAKLNTQLLLYVQGSIPVSVSNWNYLIFQFGRRLLMMSIRLLELKTSERITVRWGKIHCKLKQIGAKVSFYQWSENFSTRVSSLKFECIKTWNTSKMNIFSILYKNTLFANCANVSMPVVFLSTITDISVWHCDSDLWRSLSYSH